MARDDTPISDRLKQAVDDLEIEAKVQAAATAAEDAVVRGLDAAGRFVADHRTDIETLLDRAGDVIDQRTAGRYADRVDRVRGELSAGIARLSRRTGHDEPPDS